MTDPTPSVRRGRHASPDAPGAGAPGAGGLYGAEGLRQRRAVPAARHGGGPADDGSTGPLPGEGARPVPPRWTAGGQEGSTHPSAPLPDLPPRPPGAWSRMQRRTDVHPDDDATVAQSFADAPGLFGGEPDDDPAGHHPGDPHGWDDEHESTGGLEVIGASGADDSRRSRRGHDDGGGSGRAPRRRSPLAVVLSLVVLAGLIAGIVFGGKAIIDLVNPPSQDFAGQGSGSVEIRISVGDTLSDIARSLVDGGVIASVGPFVEAAETEPAARGIQPGVYAMRSQMSGQAALDLLLDPATRLFSRVTIPEGFTVAQILQRLSEGTQKPIEELQAATADPAALGLPAYANGQLEGYLFPATYDFQPDDAPVDMLRAMVGRFTETAATIQLEERAAAAGRSVHDVVTIASMVQSETRLDAERPDVAQVVYNRLSQGTALGIDATLAYGLGKNGNDLTVADLQTDSPYNTRTRAGLPPTPISSPGEASLEAALAPTTGDLLYYVLENQDGKHFFTSDYAEFMAARERCAAAGLGCGG
ncbi:endolytic transglycosylase MltG [Geodermatophilus sp. CPCC 206100]|uniref:endolytic transglycosylase MltG n=1 Tax=Geodermatophilus sp. CPCC 206100 TaxID=3020054 RepID=UPI003B009126